MTAKSIHEKVCCFSISLEFVKKLVLEDDGSRHYEHRILYNEPIFRVKDGVFAETSLQNTKCGSVKIGDLIRAELRCNVVLFQVALKESQPEDDVLLARLTR